jgi:hypothetical protein
MGELGHRYRRPGTGEGQFFGTMYTGQVGETSGSSNPLRHEFLCENLFYERGEAVAARV